MSSPLPGIQYTMGGGQYNLNTQVPGMPHFGPGSGSGFGFGMPVDPSFLIRRKLAQQDQDNYFTAQMRKLALQQAQQAAQPQERPLDMQGGLNRAQEEQAHMRLLEAASNPVPQKFIEGRPGLLGGYAPDVTLLPQALLPKSSEMQQGGRGTQEQLDYARATNMKPGEEELADAQARYYQQQNRLAAAAAAQREEQNRQEQLRRSAGTWEPPPPQQQQQQGRS